MKSENMSLSLPVSLSLSLPFSLIDECFIDKAMGGGDLARRCQFLRVGKNVSSVTNEGHEYAGNLSNITSAQRCGRRQMNMKTAIARTLQNSSSRRHFHWAKKVGNEEDEVFEASSSKPVEEDEEKGKGFAEEPLPQTPDQAPKKKLQQAMALSRLRTVLTIFSRNRLNVHLGLGSRVVGTLFGSRRGHVNFAFQRDPSSPPAFLIELAAPISFLVKEMSSGLVRIALECDRAKEDEKKPAKLLEESVWRTFCNGKKCGFGTRRECGEKETKILKAVEPISMGAGVLPETEGESGSDGELMYLRAKFERIIGSRDSEAFYMMNPDSNGAPELSIYLLRV